MPFIVAGMVIAIGVTMMISGVKGTGAQFFEAFTGLAPSGKSQSAELYATAGDVTKTPGFLGNLLGGNLQPGDPGVTTPAAPGTPGPLGLLGGGTLTQPQGYQTKAPPGSTYNV